MVMWVFGYGSLIWRPCFNYDERVVGYIRDYKRVFHQACIDFRGTVEKPGRTLTLEPQEGSLTWGVAYRVTAEVEKEMCMTYLDRRERTYDVKAVLDFYTHASGEQPAIVGGVLTYIATPESSLWYLGPAPLEEMAAQIACSHGPAGPNHEYLFRLEQSLLQIGVDCLERETSQLANEVRRILLRFKQLPHPMEVQDRIRPFMTGRRCGKKPSVRILPEPKKFGWKNRTRPDGYAESKPLLRIRRNCSYQSHGGIWRSNSGFRNRHGPASRQKTKKQSIRRAAVH